MSDIFENSSTRFSLLSVVDLRVAVSEDRIFEHNGNEWQVIDVDHLFNSLIKERERRRR